MSLSWSRLRPWKGSQFLAFEELCCQLAHHESAPQGSTFFRVGTPDAGVEAYWKLKNGDEWGWQAKFFLSTPGISQWRQIDASVKTCLYKHPRLVRYTICLPLDRPDPRIKKQKWFIQAWNEHVAKWTSWTKTRKMRVKFNYWGEHELMERLSREEHKGRSFFWFNKELFSDQWFDDRLEEAIKNIGPRYTPLLNVELSVAHLFDGLGRTPAFYSRLRDLWIRVRRNYDKGLSDLPVTGVGSAFLSAKAKIGQLIILLDEAQDKAKPQIDLDEISDQVSESQKSIAECLRSLEEVSKVHKGDEKKGTEGRSPIGIPSDPSYRIDYLDGLYRVLEEIAIFCASSEMKLATIPSLLLVGKAGVGKSHLFCDVAEQRNRKQMPTILLLGSHFENREPWTQIIGLLGLSCSRDEFLGALQTAGEAHDAKVMILLDALNEGDGKYLWNKHLAGMLTVISRYRSIALGISVRTTYEEMIVPKELIGKELVREAHQGFAEHEFEATGVFFAYYGIKRPSIPLLPEFRNPLFLKLVCEGIKKQGLVEMPPGLKGITSILDFYVDSVNKKLATKDFLDFDSRIQYVKLAIDRLAHLMACKGSSWLRRDEAAAEVNAVLPREGHENSLFRHLISEGIITEDRFLADKGYIEGIHISYERFSDQLIVSYLLDTYLDKEYPEASFKPENDLGALIKNEATCYGNQGLVEALSIQVPERLNRELVDIAPFCKEYEPIRLAFIESIIWRHPSAFTDNTRVFIKGFISVCQNTLAQFVDVILTVASIPWHPYNARFLHSMLMKQKLAIRDAWWSTQLHNQYGEHGAVDRLIEWSLLSSDKTQVDDDSMFLAGTALSWFLCSSNRYLRDNSTKGLVRLFSDRISVLRQIIDGFRSVNDPYILERLMAVAYGCTMRSAQASEVAGLAQDIYNWIFRRGTPLPHVLLRDYARGIVESAVHKGFKLDIEINKIRPPYKSAWPKKIPSEKELKKYGKYTGEKSEEKLAELTLYDSVMGTGDFARYIIGTNSGQFEWSSHRLNKPKKLTRKQRYEQFIKSLSPSQKREWEKYRVSRMLLMPILKLRTLERQAIFKTKVDARALKADMLKARQRFLKTLGPKKIKEYENEAVPFINGDQKDESLFDLSIAQRWIFNRILELGWTGKLFGEFDRSANRYPYRGEHKPERIGKKYQWIAYHEFLALVADNYEFRPDAYSDTTAKYEGPWKLYVRDIDPSCLLSETKIDEEWSPNNNSWWFPYAYADWEKPKSNLTWLRQTEDLPKVEKLILTNRPPSSDKWINLHGHFRWEQDVPEQFERHKVRHRLIWYIINAFVVRKSDKKEISRWAKGKDFFGDWMPKPADADGIFLREYFWSPAYKYANQEEHLRMGWTRGFKKEVPVEIVPLSDRYFATPLGRDCSIGNSYPILLPSKWLADKLRIKWRDHEGQFYNDQGKLIAFDPSVYTEGPGSLLLDQDVLFGFLEENNLDIFWTVIGEKDVIGDSGNDRTDNGRLYICGVYWISKGLPKGNMWTRRELYKKVKTPGNLPLIIRGKVGDSGFKAQRAV